MGARGPRPKPTSIKRAQGTYRADKCLPAEMKPRSGAPACPDLVAADPEARAEWDRIVPDLEAAGVLALIDGAALGAYCATYSLATFYQRLAQRSPMVETIDQGLRVNPAAAEARKLWPIVRQYQAEFGLTPAARTRVQSTEGKGAASDEVEGFLFGGLRALPGGKSGR